MTLVSAEDVMVGPTPVAETLGFDSGGKIFLLPDTLPTDGILIGVNGYYRNTNHFTVFIMELQQDYTYLVKDQIIISPQIQSYYVSLMVFFLHLCIAYYC